MARCPPQVVYPSLADPRWFQLAFTLSFVGYALMSPGFSRTGLEWGLGIATCVGLDLVLTCLRSNTLIVPLSGLISSMGLLLLCDSPHLWCYPLCGALAILSKHFIRPGGKHVFNPLNFGILFGLLFFSGQMTIVGGRWGGGLPGMVLVLLLGTLTVYRAGRLDVSATYLATFLVGAVIRAFIADARLLTVVAPATGAAFQLFTFFMISDPKTTPETRSGRIVFAVLLGVLDAVLRYEKVEYAPFLALLVMCGVLPSFRHLFAPAVEEKVWKLKVWRLMPAAEDKVTVPGIVTW